MNIQRQHSTRTHSSALHAGEIPSAPVQPLHRWPQWVGYVAALWSTAYALLTLWWWAGHPGLPAPFAHPPAAADPVGWGILEDLGAGRAAALALGSAAIGLSTSRTGAPQRAGPMLAVAAWCVAVTLLLGVPDAQAVALLAYAPFLILGAPFGWPPVKLPVVLPWPVVHQLFCVVGGTLWAITAIAATRRVRGACAHCGRGRVRSRWTSKTAAARWGAVATGVAVVIPLLYATTRLAWAVGIPLGITDEFLREGQAIGMWAAGAALSSVAIAGAGLTTGLVLPWGEVFPGWIPRVGGRRVPPWLAVAPASVMACLFLAAGIGAVEAFVIGGFPEEGWGTTAPTLLWPVWGLALGAATLAYHYRRRGPCQRCGRS